MKIQNAIENVFKSTSKKKKGVEMKMQMEDEAVMQRASIGWGQGAEPGWSLGHFGVDRSAPSDALRSRVSQGRNHILGKGTE